MPPPAGTRDGALPACAIARRRALLLAAAALATPRPARAQAALPVVGLLHPGRSEVARQRAEDLALGLRARGYTAWRNVIIQLRAAEDDPALLRRIAAEFAAQPVGLAVAAGREAILALRARGPALRIVAVDLESDPAEPGFAPGPARGGGGLTGIFLDAAALGAALAGLVAEAMPGRTRIGVLADPMAGAAAARATQAALAARGLAAELVTVAGGDALQAVVAAAAARLQGAVVMASPLFSAAAAPLATLCQAYRLPALAMAPDFAEAGGLVSYGPALDALFRQAGELAGRVLGGAPPASLPVQAPLRFRLAVNIATAEALGLPMPGLVLRADAVFG